MSTRRMRKVAWIRQELRERLMADRRDGVGEVLATLRNLVDEEGDPRSDLRSEYERWKLRFELIAAAENQRVTVR